VKDLLTSVLEVLGMLAVVSGLAWFWARLLPEGWSLPVGLILWGVGLIGVAWMIGVMDETSKGGGDR